MSDLVFDIKEFGLHDGAGLRTTVFLKGCPLSCEWCHNPEGQSFSREVSKNTEKCRHCGLCERKCSHPECRGLGVCLKICPNDCIRAVGEEMTPEGLAARIMKNRRFLKYGGVTFSGGEPACHPEFIKETVSLLDGMNTAIETCGYAQTESFLDLLSHIDCIFMDIKLIDDAAHIKYTGKSNRLILENARAIAGAGRNVTFRVPLVPTVTDTEENLDGIAEFLAPYRENISVEFIPYNRLTGAKYRSLGREYRPSFDEKLPVSKNTAPFEKRKITCRAF